MLLCRPHGPRTLGAIVEEYMTMSALAASRQEAQEEREEREEREASITPPVTGDHWNHEVHARGAAFGFNTIPFISQAERS